MAFLQNDKKIRRPMRICLFRYGTDYLNTIALGFASLTALNQSMLAKKPLFYVELQPKNVFEAKL